MSAIALPVNLITVLNFTYINNASVSTLSMRVTSPVDDRTSSL